MHTRSLLYTFIALASALAACGAPEERVGYWGDSLNTAGGGGMALAGTGGSSSSEGGSIGGAAAGAPGAGGTGGGGVPTGGIGGTGSGGTGGTLSGTGGTGTGGAAGQTASGGSGGQRAGGMGGTMSSGGSGGAAAGGTSGTSDTARFNFEAGTHQWTDLTRSRIAGHTDVQPTRSTVRQHAGAASLEYAMSATAATERVVGVVASNIGTLPAGATVTFQLWVPDDHKFENVQAFVQTYTAGSWHQDFKSGTSLQKNAWNRFSLVVPSTYTGQNPLELGFFFRLSGAWTGKVWIDAVDVK